jgi:hypothetical protein
VVWEEIELVNTPQDLVSSLTELLASRLLDLSLIASAADVVAADARFNQWVALEAKRKLSSDAVLQVIGDYEDATAACQSAIEKFRATRDGRSLQAALNETLLVLKRRTGG